MQVYAVARCRNSSDFHQVRDIIKFNCFLSDGILPRYSDTIKFYGIYDIIGSLNKFSNYEGSISRDFFNFFKI